MGLRQGASEPAELAQIIIETIVDAKFMTHIIRVKSKSASQARITPGRLACFRGEYLVTR